MERQSLILYLFGLTVMAGSSTSNAQPTAPPPAPPVVQSAQAPTNPPAPPGSLGRTNSVFGHFEDMNNLSPEERRAKMQELRQRRGLTNAAPNRIVSPEERRAKLEARLAELRAKKANGTLTSVEERQLEGLERFSQHRQPGLPTLPQATNSANQKPAETPK